MLLKLFVGALICIVSLLYLKWLKVKSFWAKKNVPHNAPHPILGSLTYLQKKNAGEWMREIYVNFKNTPYVGIWLMWKPALVMNCPEIARRVLVKDTDVFRDRNLGSGKSDPIGGLNIFTVNSPLWTTVRRRLTSVYTTAKLKIYQPMVINKSKELCQRIRSEIEKGKAIDVRGILTDYTTDVTGTSSFGIECNGTLTGDCAMRRITREFQTYSLYRGIAHACIFFLPEFVDIFRFSFFPKSAEDYFRKIFHTVVEQRGGFNKPVEDQKDLVDALIKMKQDEKVGAEMSTDLLIAQAAIFVQGGFETSSGTLTFALYELTYCPEAQEKLYQELAEIKERLDGKYFDTESLQEAVYLNCVIKETLRKYPPMGWLDRISSKEYKIDDNLTIPAGITVYVNAIAMQWDPEYFFEPEKFIPERFLPENEKQIKAFTYLPFGDGPRNCIGRRFAQLTSRFALAELILQYELRPRPNMPQPNECKFEKQSLFLIPGQFLSVDFVPRS